MHDITLKVLLVLSFSYFAVPSNAYSLLFVFIWGGEEIKNTDDDSVSDFLKYNFVNTYTKKLSVIVLDYIVASTHFEQMIINL